MNFSKEEIVSKNFSKKNFRGLNEFEVRDFLQVLAEQIRHLTQENHLLKKDLKEKNGLIQDYRDREHLLKESISNAEKWADNIKQSAEEQKQLVLEKAQSDSENLIQSAKESLQTVYKDIADLKRLQIQFRTGLKAALQVQMDLLDQDNAFNPLSSFNSSEKNLALENPEKLQSPQSQQNSDSQQNQHNQKVPLPENPNKEGLDQDLSSLKESLSSIDKSFS